MTAVHFVGVGGSGMSGIARLFLQAGIAVTGSDRSESANVTALRGLGAQIAIGHDAAHVGEVDAVVVTGALWKDNPEYLAALERGIPVLHRSQALKWLIGRRRLISVAGAHGKTTSTGMIVTALLALDEDPSFVNGGVIEALGTSSAHGSGELFVAEADESDGSFLLYDTAVALITNVDPDHLDHYGTLERFEAAFVTFASAARERVVLSADDPGARDIAARLVDQRVVTFGESPQADARLSDVTATGPVSFTIHWRGQSYAVALRIPGRQNAVNATGAFATLAAMGFDPHKIIEALQTFRGTRRRFELRGTVGGVSVYDDYAHHPTEIQAALTAARSVLGGGRIIAVHQPHLYSRTKIFANEFAKTLERYADQTIVLDVCGAREDPVPGVTGALVSERFHDPSKVAYIADWQKAADYTASLAREGDFIITLGCGDVYRIIPQLLESLHAARG
ncbi:MAG TPA: UDP-N-acetylmuramate--L-alanine ligase [Microbacteriaceae bacterium]|nr:UDP-N-acetylmuramate--L-alanine ligase [Microbacteriaceae bacterium]